MGGGQGFWVGAWGIAVLQLGFEKGRGIFCQKGTLDAQYFVKRALSSALAFLECFLMHVNLCVINNCKNKLFPLSLNNSNLITTMRNKLITMYCNKRLLKIICTKKNYFFFFLKGRGWALGRAGRRFGKAGRVALQFRPSWSTA